MRSILKMTGLVPSLQQAIIIMIPEYSEKKSKKRKNLPDLQRCCKGRFSKMGPEQKNNHFPKTNGYIKIPIGLLETVRSKASDCGITCDILDKRCHGRPLRVHFKGELREQQDFAAIRLEQYENGVLWAPTAFGKWKFRLNGMTFPIVSA